MEEKDPKKEVLGRLIAFKDYTGMNLHAFCASIGMGHTTVFNQVAGNRALSLDTILKTVEAYSDLSADWLLRGNGNMIISNETQSQIEERYKSRIEKLIDTIQFLSETIKNKNSTIDALAAELAQCKKDIQKA